jgi:predicted dehydrogenase
VSDGPSVLVAGYGSIGRRHIDNLKRLGVKRISVYRTGRGSLDPGRDSSLEVFLDLGKALSAAPDAVVVANPTSVHLETAWAAAEAGCALLIEKPVSHCVEGLAGFLELVEERRLPVLVGYQFRMHPGLAAVRRWIVEGKLGGLVSLDAHWGEYLPGWHPWEDYRQGYSARTELGGGVVLTLSHPFDTLRWLGGEVNRVSGATVNRSGLEVDAEDTAAAVLRFASGAIGSVTLNYSERPPAHFLRVVGRKGTAVWDAATGGADFAGSETDPPESFRPDPSFERNTMFLDEMAQFLDCVAGRATPACTLRDGLRALEIALAVKRASRDGKETDAHGWIG